MAGEQQADGNVENDQTDVVAQTLDTKRDRRLPKSAARRAYATLTKDGLEALRGARRTHHAVVRERFLGRLSSRDLERLAALWEKAGTADPMVEEALAALPERP